MPLSAKSPATRAALLYITVGSIAIVWTLIWIVYLLNHPPNIPARIICVRGCLATGAIVLLIGICIGSIGRTAREAEPPNVRLRHRCSPQTCAVIAPMVSSNSVPTTNGTATAAAPMVPPVPTGGRGACRREQWP